MAMAYDKDSVARRADLNHDVLFSVMMKVGFIDIFAFGGVCKSWRSLALFNRKKFMASRPPMYLSISTGSNDKDCFCYLEDFEGRKFKTLLPHSGGRECVGLTCGYLILFGKEKNDYCLVNPITSHQLHFPCVPSSLTRLQCPMIRAILVFSPSSGWLLVITEKLRDQVWFSVAGKGVWNNVHVSTDSKILDLHVVKGKIYTLNTECPTEEVRYICEMRLGIEPKLMLLETKNFPKNSKFLPEFGNSDENLHLFEHISGDSYKVHQLDFGEIKWVYHEKTNEEYTFYRSHLNCKTGAFKRESWTGNEKSRKGRNNYAALWYFPHDCLNVNLIEDY